MKIKCFIMFLSWFVVSLSSVLADERYWSGKIYHKQLISAHESIASARMLAVDSIRQKAALQAGAVVVNTETIRDDKYNAITQVIGVTIVKLTEVSEKIVPEGKQVHLEVEATATVDLNLLNEKIDYLIENRSLSEELSKLQTKYLALQADKGMEQDAKVHLIKVTQNAFKRWISTYELKGSAGVTNTRVAQAEAMLLNNVLLEVVDSGEVHSVIEVVELEDNFEIYVSIQFDYDAVAVDQALSVFWETRYRANIDLPYVVAIGSRKAGNEYTALEYRRIFEYISSFKIFVEVDIFGQRKRVPIAYLGNGFTPGCVINNDYKTSTNYCISKLLVDQPFNTRHYKSPLMFLIDKDIAVAPEDLMVKGRVVLGRI